MPDNNMEVLNPTIDLQEGESVVTVTQYPTQLLNEPLLPQTAPTPPSSDSAPPAPPAPQSSASQGEKQDA